MVYLLNQYANILKEAASKIGGDVSILGLTETLKSEMHQLLGAVKAGDGVAEHVLKNYNISEASLDFVREKHAEKLQRLEQSIDNNDRLDLIMQEVTDLLIGFSQLELELLDVSKLETAFRKSEATSNVLAEALDQPNLTELQIYKDEANLSGLRKATGLNLILASKLLGKECEPDADFESLINRLKDGKSYVAFDPTEVLRLFWIAGKADWDQTKAIFEVLDDDADEEEKK